MRIQRHLASIKPLLIYFTFKFQELKQFIIYVFIPQVAFSGCIQLNSGNVKQISKLHYLHK